MLKKCIGTVIYKSDTNQIIYYKINHKGNNITFIDNSRNIDLAYKFSSFNDLYKSVLDIAKNNGYYFDSYIDFNSTWFNIDFMDFNNPVNISKYGFKSINENKSFNAYTNKSNLIIYKAISNLTGKFKYILICENSKQYTFDYGYHLYDNCIEVGYYVEKDLSCKFDEIIESLKNNGYEYIKFYSFQDKYL